MSKGISGRRPALDAGMARRVRDWSRLGTNVPEVARRLGVSPRTIWRYVRCELKHYREEVRP